jgi:LCP family protein required for cell wall assembly
VEDDLTKREKAVIFFEIVLFIAILIAVVSFIKVNIWEKPLGPELGFEDTGLPDSATQTQGNNLDGELANASTPTLESLDTQVPVGEVVVALELPVVAIDPHCDGPTEMTILAIGTDSRKDSYLYGLADVIRLVHVDFVTPRVAVLTFPRDLWVEVPGISDHHGITHSKLNQAFFYGTPGMGYYDGPGDGAGLLARTLEQNFGLRVEHYFVVNMRTFEDIINAVGGVTIYLPVAIDATDEENPEDNMGFYPKGWNNLSGLEAVRFSRIRKIDTVFDRSNRQTKVLCALKEKLLRPSTITKFPDLIKSFFGRVITDLSMAELFQLACLVPQISSENLVFASFPRDLFKPDRTYDHMLDGYTYVWDVDFNALSSYTNQFLEGTWPVSTSDSSGLTCP